MQWLTKPALPLLKYGSKAELTDGDCAAEEAIVPELASKPEKVWDKIIPGKMDRLLTTPVGSVYTISFAPSLHH